MKDFIATSHRAMRANVDEYIRSGVRPRSLAERRVEREICYADHLKAIVEQVEESRRSAA
jgi:hypothetical protein